MPLVIALRAVLVGACFWLMCARMGVEAAREPSGLASPELADLPTTGTRVALIVSLQDQLGEVESEAREALILGRWLMDECAGPQAALIGLALRLMRMQGASALGPLMAVLNDVATRRGRLNDRQRDALDVIARQFKLG